MATTIAVVALCMVIGALLVLLSQSAQEKSELRLQNERLIARIAQEYHFSSGRTGEPPPIHDTPSSPPMFAFKRSNPPHHPEG